MKTAPTFNDETRELIIATMAYGIALVDQLPSHLVRPLFRDNACRLLEAYSGVSNSEKLIARAKRQISKNLQPVAKQPTGEW